MLSVIMLSVYAECHCAECHYAKCRYAECCSVARSLFILITNTALLAIFWLLLEHQIFYLASCSKLLFKSKKSFMTLSLSQAVAVSRSAVRCKVTALDFMLVLWTIIVATDFIVTL
jgi:hypothetical protein